MLKCCWEAVLVLFLSPSPFPEEHHYLQACRVMVSGQFIEHIWFSSQGDHLPGTFQAWALEALYSKKPLSPRQTRMTDHLIIFHILTEPEETLETTVIPTQWFLLTCWLKPSPLYQFSFFLIHTFLGSEEIIKYCDQRCNHQHSRIKLNKRYCCLIL